MDRILVLVDLILLRPPVYRHLLVNLLPRRADAFAVSRGPCRGPVVMLHSPFPPCARSRLRALCVCRKLAPQLLSRMLLAVIAAVAFAKLYLVATTSASHPPESSPAIIPFRARRLLLTAAGGRHSVLDDALTFAFTATVENTVFAVAAASTLLAIGGAAAASARFGPAAAVGACAVPPAVVAASMLRPTPAPPAAVAAAWAAAVVGASVWGNEGFLVPADPEAQEVEPEVDVPGTGRRVLVGSALVRLASGRDALAAAVARCGSAASLTPADVVSGPDGCTPVCELVDGAGAELHEPGSAEEGERPAEPGVERGGEWAAPPGGGGAGEAAAEGEAGAGAVASADPVASWAMLALAVGVALTVSSWPRLYSAAGLVWDISATELAVVTALTRASNAAAISAVTNRGWLQASVAVIGGFCCEALASTVFWAVGLNDAVAHF